MISCCAGMYYCPRTGENECMTHGEYQSCCDRPETHRYIDAKVSLTKEEQIESIAARRERKRTADDSCAQLAWFQVNATTLEEKQDWGKAYHEHGCQKSPKFNPQMSAAK